jgi:tetratricopeptide (TPR) repeat protein
LTKGASVTYRKIKARMLHRQARTLWQDGNIDRAGRLAFHALDLLPVSKSITLTRVADRVSVLETLAHLASEMANHAEAQRYCDEALDLLEQAGANPRCNAWRVALLIHKGNSQRLAANYDEAALTLSHALAIAEQTAGSQPLSAGPLNALGILAKDRGHYEDAQVYYDRALSLLASSGTAVSDLASVYHNFAGLAHVQGRFAEAEEPAREAIRLRRASDTPDPAGLAADLSVLGAILAGQERLEDAVAVLSEALTLWRSRYGDRHYEVAVQLDNLAAIMQSQRKYPQAESALREALAIKQRVLGNQHPEIATLLNNLATVYSDTDRIREAKDCYDTAIKIFTDSLGMDHPSTVACTQNRDNLGKDQT